MQTQMSIVLDKEDLADQTRKQAALKWCKKIITRFRVDERRKVC